MADITSTIAPSVKWRDKISQERRHAEPAELEEHNTGFVCNECGWRGVSAKICLPSEHGGTDIKIVCQECGGTDVANMLSEHVASLERIYEQEADTPGEPVPYTHFVEKFGSTDWAFEDALNYLYTDGKATITMSDDGAFVILHI